MPPGIPLRHKVCESPSCDRLYMPRGGAQRYCPACQAARAVRRALAGRGRATAEQGVR